MVLISTVLWEVLILGSVNLPSYMIVLNIWGPLNFHIYFKISLWASQFLQKKPTGILIKIKMAILSKLTYTESQFGENYHLIILSLPINQWTWNIPFIWIFFLLEILYSFECLSLGSSFLQFIFKCIIYLMLLQIEFSYFFLTMWFIVNI